MPMLSVFAPLLKSCFFGFYVINTCRRDEGGGGTKAPPCDFLSCFAVGRGFTPAANYAIIPPTKASDFA